jgi:hypothetical protein
MPGSWVVINSNGYIVHPGILFQKDFVTLFKPAHIFLLHTAGKAPDALDEAQINVSLEKIRPFKSVGDSRILRELRVTTYFLRGKPPVSAQQPIPVALKEIRVGVAIDEYYDVLQMPALLSGSVVMLCIDEGVPPVP